MPKSSSGAIVVLSLAAAVVIAACATTRKTDDSLGVGPVVHRLDAEVSQSLYGMASTAHPDASRIAVEILESGGNAIDAAVAAAFALGVADSGDSGLGGSTYILIRFADGRATAIDGSALVPRVLWSPHKGSTFYAEILPPVTGEHIDELGSFGFEPITLAIPPARLSKFSRFGLTNAVYFDRGNGMMTGVGDPRRTGTSLGVSF